MEHIRWYGLIIAGVLLLAIAVLSMQKRRRQRVIAPEVGDVREIEEIEHDVMPVVPPIKKKTQEIIVINLLKNSSEAISGYELLDALLGADLQYGDMQIFHCYRTGQHGRESVFSVASATEPGYFDLTTMQQSFFHGVSLFLKVQGSVNDIEDFDLFVETARRLAEELNVQLYDRTRNPLTTQILTQWKHALI